MALTYFGPCFAIYIFYMKKIKAEALEIGIGVYICFIITFILLFTTEARGIMNFFPFIIFAAVLFLRKNGADKRTLVYLTIFSLILSKAYLPLKGIPDSSFKITEFPNQLFFMNTYLCSNEGYLIQLPAAAVICALTVYLIRKNGSSDTEAANV